MRWVPLWLLAGCVPISADDFSGGREAVPDVDSGQSNAEAREDAGTMDSARIVDSAGDGGEDSATIAPPPRLEDGGVPTQADAAVIQEDAGFVLDAGRLDAGTRVDAGKDTGVVDSGPVLVTCATQGVLCDEFEMGLRCPSVAGPNWSECEHIADATGPVIEELAGGSHAMRSRVSDEARSRSQRVLRSIPLDADSFEAEFWLIVDPTPNADFTMVKLQQEAGIDANGEPLFWPGISLVGSGDRFLLVVESALSLTQEPFYSETVLGALPHDWARATLKISWRPQLKVELQLGNYPIGGVTIDSLPNNVVPVTRQYFALGLYSEQGGAVQMLFDDVFAHATKGGKLLPLP